MIEATRANIFFDIPNYQREIEQQKKDAKAAGSKFSFGNLNHRVLIIDDDAKKRNLLTKLALFVSRETGVELDIFTADSLSEELKLFVRDSIRQAQEEMVKFFVLSDFHLENNTNTLELLIPLFNLLRLSLQVEDSWAQLVVTSSDDDVPNIIKNDKRIYQGHTLPVVTEDIDSLEKKMALNYLNQSESHQILSLLRTFFQSAAA